MLPPVVYALFGTCIHSSVGTGGLVSLLTGEQLDALGPPTPLPLLAGQRLPRGTIRRYAPGEGRPLQLHHRGAGCFC